MKSDADLSSWWIRSCVGTDRDDKRRQLQHTSLTLGKAMIALRIKGRQSLCRQSALPRPIQGETINAGGDYWLSHSQSSSGKLAILQGQIIQAPGTGRQSALWSVVSINGSHSRRGKGVGWVAFPPPHITVCSLYIVAVGRLICGSLLLTAARGLRGWTERKTA